MSQVEKDEERENRIYDEAIVDAYGPEEQALGWYYYPKGKSASVALSEEGARLSEALFCKYFEVEE